MPDIQCVACGTLSATPIAHQGHICRPPAQVAVRFAEPVRQGNAHFPPNTAKGRKPKMAGVILCDRCGGITTERAAGAATIQLNPELEPEDFGLCPNCVKELWQWFKATDDARKALPTYVKPFDPDEVAEPVVDQKATTARALAEHVKDERGFTE